MEKERKTGEIFEYNGEWYQCVEELSWGVHCNGCDFIGRICSKLNPKCSPVHHRSDGKSVIFKKLEKVGEPFERNGYMYQEYKAHTYPLLMSGGAKIPTDNGFAVITKQNEEDMEEYKMHDAKEDIPEFDKVVDDCLFGEDKPNLKPFDLEAAKSGKPVCTRDGRKATVWTCTLENKNFPVVAIVSCGQEENVYQYDANGVCDEHDENLDLMMLPEKKRGWIIVSKNATIYNNLEDAKKSFDLDKELCICKVEWEE